MRKKKLGLLLTVGATSLALLTAPLSAFAEGGGGSGSGTGYSQSARGNLHYVFYDDALPDNSPKQGTMQSSIDYFTSGKLTGGVSLASEETSQLRPAIYNACTTALQRAEARNPQPDGKSRVVGLFWGSARSTWSGYAQILPSEVEQFYTQWVNDGRPSVFLQNNLSSYEAYQQYIGYIEQGKNEAIQDMNSNSIAACIALNSNEPPQNYQLSVTTDKASPFTMAGTTTPVSDTLHASANGSSIRENVSATVSLIWDSKENQATKRVNKTVTITNSGDTKSPDFTPADFGWTSWAGGSFWFDVTVGKQGKMANTVDTPDRDPRETWTVTPKTPTKELYKSGENTLLGADVLASAQAYDAHITAHSNGYTSSMTITDTIKNVDVWIGSDTSDNKDAVYVLDPTGKKTPATITIDRSKTGEVNVSALMENLANQGDYTLVVPTFTKPTGEDYTISDTGKVCYTTSLKECMTTDEKQTEKVTPDPDKVWVLDETGALASQDIDWTNKVAADDKTFVHGESISAVVNGSIKAHLTNNLTKYELVDDWSDAARFIDFTDVSKAKVFYGGRDVTDQFTITVKNNQTIATAKKAFLDTTKGLAADKPTKLVITGVFKDLSAPTDTDGKVVTMRNAGSETWNNETKETNEPPIFITTPKPDKVWVLDENGGLTSQDIDWTNKVAADQKLFFHEDTVGAVVNGRVPANLARNLTNYVLVDDWSDAARFIDFTDVSKAKVFYGGRDVTDQFTITVKNNQTIATAKKAFLDATKGLEEDVPTKLIIMGEFYPVTEETDTNGEMVTLLNKGSETWNNSIVSTNIPPVFIWNPNPTKDVLSSAKQDGDQTSIDGQQVFPNQWIEYLVNVDVNFPKTGDNLARKVDNFQVRDDYDPNFEIDKTSIEFYDARTNKAISKKNYSLSFDEENSAFTATFTQDWIDSQLMLKEQGDLLLRFDGKIAGHVDAGTVIQNQAFEIINKSTTETNIPKVTIPSPKPDKEDLNKDLIDIDKKTVVGGETIMYRLTMDATPSRDKLAYDVHKLGMVDDFDEEYLDLSADKITVVEKDTGKDVTDAFNVEVTDGVAYVFAKLVDTVNQNGETITAVQPKSLKDYANQAIDPINDPIINQELLGKQYWIYLPTTVKKVTDGYVIENTALQNTENMILKTRIVSNPEKEITPDKDVTIDVGGESVDKGEIKLNSLFNYRLTSSILPSNMAEKATEWSIVDDYDEISDRYTGQWVAVAERDLYDGDTLIAKVGEQIDGHLANAPEHTTDTLDTGLFTVTEKDGVITVVANEAYLDLVNSRPDMEHGFSIYVQMERILPATVTNTFTESYNHVEREPEPVETFTPEHPAIDVEKWDTASGKENGDRDTDKDALTIDSKDVKNPVKITYTITNTGDVPLQDIVLTDKTVKGDGKVETLSCPDVDVLQPSEEMTCTATITGLEAGSSHTNTATVTGHSVYTDKEVTDHDDWNAQVTAPPLPNTGASITAVLVASLLLCGMGALILTSRKKLISES
ncbi:cell surface antigen [Streptococcus equi subsp. zooepidemicus Sz12is]|uniref:LPXTG cell wall anchor domain-containing protein n=1 Tax=Streptococcus equi TaxID=1336 RepID=UPI0005BBBAC2|nr:LPXTG cell wall anchor domain-containing protein [Streptococcus equi]KIS05184.1 cell surface antigen [Streptococcus equi subsp. zooepidemicus Sz12is]